MISTLTPIIQRTAGIVRGTLRQSERIGRRLVSDGFGLVQRVRHLGSAPKPGMDDVTLARKVETEIFRSAGSPKGTVDVNVVEGVVYLRGEVKRPAQIKELELRTRKIPEVRGVENLLHLPKTPARTRADAPGRARRTAGTSSARSQRSARTRTSEPAPKTQERPVPGAEPSPREIAESGEGRQPAPLGSSPTATDGQEAS